MNINDFMIIKKSKEEILREEIFNSLFENDKFNTVYTTGMIDTINSLLKSSKNSNITSEDLLYVLKSFKDNEIVLKNEQLKIYLDLLIYNHVNLNK
jgi:hypothetical protein